jgi:hypothetical protein
MARGNQLSMRRQDMHGELYARWDQTPALAPFTVRRSTLRALIGMGYVKTIFDAGLFLPGQSFGLTASGRRISSRTH